jgi:alcohol dehydrogenase
VVLMGGVAEDVGIPYSWLMRNCVTIQGQWMYPRDAVARLAGLVRSGLLKLDDFKVTSFGLDDVNDAVVHAAANAGPFRMTVLRP